MARVEVCSGCFFADGGRLVRRDHLAGSWLDGAQITAKPTIHRDLKEKCGMTSLLLDRITRLREQTASLYADLVATEAFISSKDDDRPSGRAEAGNSEPVPLASSWMSGEA